MDSFERMPKAAFGFAWHESNRGDDMTTLVSREDSMKHLIKNGQPSKSIVERPEIDHKEWSDRAAQELVDNLRAGCAGLIVAPDTFDWQVAIQQAFANGLEQDAEVLYAQTLPAIVFVMQSLDALTCYGKRIAAWRMGFEVQHDRGVAPTAFGLECARRFARRLGPLRSQTSFNDM